MSSLLILQNTDGKRGIAQRPLHQKEFIEQARQQGKQVVQVAIDKLTLTQIRNEIDHADEVMDCIEGLHDDQQEKYQKIITYTDARGGFIIGKRKQG